MGTEPAVTQEAAHRCVGQVHREGRARARRSRAPGLQLVHQLEAAARALLPGVRLCAVSVYWSASSLGYTLTPSGVRLALTTSLKRWGRARASVAHERAGAETPTRPKRITSKLSPVDNKHVARSSFT